MSLPTQPLAARVAEYCAHVFELTGSHVSFPAPQAVDAAMDRTPAGALRACALDLRSLLGHFPEGRKALRDLGFEPVRENADPFGGRVVGHR